MRADVFDIDEGVTAHSRAPRFARYELDVIGAGVADVVACAGGWLFDRVMAGWDVTVAVPRTLGAAPLQILGVRSVALDTLVDGRPATRALAVAGPMCHADDLVRDVVGAALMLGSHGGHAVGGCLDPHAGQSRCRGSARIEFSRPGIQGAGGVSGRGPTRPLSRRSRRSSATAGRCAPTTRTCFPSADAGQRLSAARRHGSRTRGQSGRGNECLP